MDEKYFDHDADIGIIGQGKTLEECFIDGAFAMFAMMGNLSLVTPQIKIGIDFTESEIDLAFVTWLNLLLAKAQEKNLILSRFELSHHNGDWHGRAWGNVWNESIERGIEVKGATLTMLSVRKVDNNWEARCVVDV